MNKRSLKHRSDYHIEVRVEYSRGSGMTSRVSSLLWRYMTNIAARSVYARSTVRQGIWQIEVSWVLQRVPGWLKIYLVARQAKNPLPCRKAVLEPCRCRFASMSPGNLLHVLSIMILVFFHVIQENRVAENINCFPRSAMEYAYT